IFRRGTHREFIEVGLAEENRIGLAKSGDDMSVIRRTIPRQDLAAGGGGHAANAQVVLDRDGQPGQRAKSLAGLASAMDGSGLLARAGFIEVEKGGQERIEAGNGFQTPAEESLGGQFATGQTLEQAGGGGRHGDYSITGGTPKNPASFSRRGSGAGARTS